MNINGVLPFFSSPLTSSLAIADDAQRIKKINENEQAFRLANGRKEDRAYDEVQGHLVNYH